MEATLSMDGTSVPSYMLAPGTDLGGYQVRSVLVFAQTPMSPHALYTAAHQAA